MDAHDMPPGSDQPEHTTPDSLTQPFGSGPAGGSGESSGEPSRGPRRPRRLARWIAGLGLAALLVGGGSLLGANLRGSLPGKPVDVVLAGSGSGAAALGGATLGSLLGAPMSLTSISDPANGHRGPGLHRCIAAARRLRATGHLAAARAKLHSCIRFLRLLGAVHGQLTFRTRAGFRTVAFERGVVHTVSSSSVVITSADGATFTWHLSSATIVIRARHRMGASALAAGEHVFVAGPVTSGADIARLIVIRR